MLEQRELFTNRGEPIFEYREMNGLEIKCAIVEARKLAAADVMVGSSDPYVYIILEGGQRAKTTIK